MTKKIIKTIKYIVVFGFFLALCSALTYCSMLPEPEDWHDQTTPLSVETINILCENFNLDDNHSLCNHENPIYGPDYYQVIRETFMPKNGDFASYDEVEERLGEFNYYCGQVAFLKSRNYSYFRCRYDLRGDREFIIGIYFYYPENKLYRIDTPLGYD